MPELTFPARLAIVRNKLGWNAKEAALACGFPAQNWRNWEAGKKPHDYEQVCQQIHERTRVDLRWLMGANPRGGHLVNDGYEGVSAAFTWDAVA